MTLARRVLDTNVLISAALQRLGKPARVLTLTIDSGTLIFSNPTFDEIATRLLRPKFDRALSRASREEFLLALDGAAEWVEISGAPQGCRDPDDDKVIETAVVGRANCLVTGDKDLLAMRPTGEEEALEISMSRYRGFAILRSSELLRFLEEDAA